MTRLIWAWSGVITRRNERAPAVIRLAKLSDADRLRHVAAAAGRRVAPAEHRVADPLADDVALAGELGLVDPEVARDQAAVEHDLVARLDRDEVAERRAPPAAARSSPRPGPTVAVGRVRRAIRSSVRLARISWTMPTIDVGRDDAQRDEGVDRPAHQDERDAQREQDVVDEREDVLAQDLRVGPGRRRRRRVAVAGGAPAGGLGVVEATVRRRGQVGVTRDRAERGGCLVRPAIGGRCRGGHAPEDTVPAHRAERGRSRAASARLVGRRPGRAGRAGTARGRVSATRGSPARPSGAAAAGCRRSAATARSAPAA